MPVPLRRRHRRGHQVAPAEQRVGHVLLPAGDAVQSEPDGSVRARARRRRRVVPRPCAARCSGRCRAPSYVTVTPLAQDRRRPDALVAPRRDDVQRVRRARAAARGDRIVQRHRLQRRAAHARAGRARGARRAGARRDSTRREGRALASASPASSIGGAIALGAGRWSTPLLFDESPRDPARVRCGVGRTPRRRVGGELGAGTARVAGRADAGPAVRVAASRRRSVSRRVDECVRTNRKPTTTHVTASLRACDHFRRRSLPRSVSSRPPCARRTPISSASPTTTTRARTIMISCTSASSFATLTGTRCHSLGTVSTTLIALRPGLDSVMLDAGALLGIKRVTDDGGRGASHEPPRRHARRASRHARSPSATRFASRSTTPAKSRTVAVSPSSTSARTRRARSGARARTTTTTTGSRPTTSRTTR